MPRTIEMSRENLCTAGALDGRLLHMEKLASDTRHTVKYLQGQKRQQSARYVLVGAVAGLCAFIFAGGQLATGILRYKTVDLNFMGDVSPSGKGYHPSTVSDMVVDVFGSAEGKCFFAFSMIGAICILMSEYPWLLSNVYIGDDVKVPCIGVPVLSCRHFLPPLGMMIVCCMPVVRGNRNVSEKIAAMLHTMGAVMMIGGYITFEVHSLWFSSLLRGKISRRELWLRKLLILACLICACGFQFCGALASYVQSGCVTFMAEVSEQTQCAPGCFCTNSTSWLETCTDVWCKPTMQNISDSFNARHFGAAVSMSMADENGKQMLVNTARGWFLNLKQINYWFEVWAGLLMICSHLVIYYFCAERKVDLPEELPQLGSSFLQAESEFVTR